MKSSDLKVVAIILSIALFFTIITSNAVSIASVVILAKGGTPAAGNVAGGGTASGTTDGTVSGTTDGTVGGTVGGTTDGTVGGTTGDATGTVGGTTGTGTTGTGTTGTGTTGTGTTGTGTTGTGNAGGATGNAGGAAGNAGGAAGSTGGNAQQGGATGNAGGSTANKPAGGNQGGAANANDPIMANPLAAYQKAAKDIHLNGVAGYNKIGWQTPLKIEGLGMLDSVIVPILEKFMTTKDEAEVKVNEKGSDDAKNRMPISDCDPKYIKSATAVKNGANYTVTIVLAEQINPSYNDADGLVKMSREFLDMKDVLKEAANIPVVKSLDGEIRYTDYTITAVMTADGKFVSITHKGIGYIKAVLNGSINATGELEFNAEYTDFKY